MIAPSLLRGAEACDSEAFEDGEMRRRDTSADGAPPGSRGPPRQDCERRILV
jgi:hypothetical protein